MGKFKRASEIFREVDPDLKVIDGGRRNESRRKLTKVDESGQSQNDKDESKSDNDSSEWDKLEGAVCSQCGQSRLRFRPSRGVCEFCAQTMDEKELKDAEKRARDLKFVKEHNARIDKRRGKG